MAGKTRSTISKATTEKQLKKTPGVVLRRSARLNKVKEDTKDTAKKENRTVKTEIDQNESEVGSKSTGKKPKKKFVRIEKVDFRCCFKGCCQDQPIAFRSILLRQNIGVVLNDSQEEALVIPEMCCYDSGTDHRSWEVVKGSQVELQIASDEIRTSPKNPLFLDIDRLNRFDDDHRLTLSAWTRKKDPYEGIDDENQEDENYASDSSIVV